MTSGTAIPLLFAMLCAGTDICEAATVQGCIRDAHGKPLAKIEIRLEEETAGAKPNHVRAGEDGRFHIAALHAGTYLLRAETASFGPFALGETEQKTVDLVVNTSAVSIDFFDPPKYTVAGVTQSAYSGGHGSDAVKRSLEALSAAAKRLGKQPIRDYPADFAKLEKALLAQPGDSKLHHALAEAYETSGEPLAAVEEYQRAAELDRNETNLFDWASELLKHDAWEAAAEVYEAGIQKYPLSSRMLLGAAVAQYAHGEYSAAARRFYRATDLNPADPVPYLFLAKVEPREITDTQAYRDRLARFARLHPDNALANYYYAACLWKSDKDGHERGQVLSLLEQALQIDSQLAAAHLLLGDLYFEEDKPPEAKAAYEKAVEADPSVAQAHYQLSRLDRQAGNKEKAQTELAIYQQLAKASAQQLERERTELQRFVVTLKTPGSN